MSKFTKFMKKNKIVKENEQHKATKSLCDEKGDALEWEFRHISSKENEKIKDSCTIEIPINGKPNMYRQRLDINKYLKKIITASVVNPDLYDSELQDSYGVKTPEDLLLELVDDPGEYSDLINYIQKLQGFDISFEDKVEEAKN